jgi:hypothetical protein
MSSFGTFGSFGSFIGGGGNSRRPEESRIGVPWSNEEDNQLLEEIGSHMDIKEIASIHKRTPKGIKLRLIHHAVKMIETKGASLDSVAEHFNLLRTDIEEFKNKKSKEKKAADFKDKEPEYHDKYLELLTDIRDTLKLLVEKVSEPTTNPLIPNSPPISPSSTLLPSSKKLIIKPLAKVPSESSFNIDSNRATAPHSPSLLAPIAHSPSHLQKTKDYPDISLKMPLPSLKVDMC